MNPVNVYSRFSRLGLEYGPAFRNITTGRASTDSAICSISVPDTASMMPHDWETGMLIHPATFDACLQVADIAAVGGDFLNTDLHVPTFFKEITVSHGILNTPGDEIRVLATTHKPRSEFDSDVHGSFIVTDARDEAKVLIEALGYTFASIPNLNIEGALTGDRGLCWQMQREPCLDLMPREQYSVAFPMVSSLQSATRQIEDLERAAFYQLESALQSMSKKDVEIPPTHLRDLYRVLKKLLVQVQEGNWPFQTKDWLSWDKKKRDRFLADFASSDSCGHMVCSMGENLVSVLKGDVEPLSIILRDNMLETFYRSHEFFDLGSNYCADIVVKLAHQNPSMRIIEIVRIFGVHISSFEPSFESKDMFWERLLFKHVSKLAILPQTSNTDSAIVIQGAGTGATTMPVLHALGPKFAHYDFTDISAGFFERAGEEQKEWTGKISYRKLNVEEDPVGQGFEPETYDLVIAANVLHATVNIDNTMRNVRKLLRLGGKAVTAELTTQLLSNAIVFGTLPGKMEQTGSEI